MKIFNSTKEWEEKVNFVDQNNVLVGFDLAQSCCEHADWFISQTEDKEPSKEGNGIVEGLDDYRFDKEYFVQVELDKDEYNYSCLDEGGMVRFKLTAANKPDLFLHIYNSHNGYYSHGFEMRDGDKQLQSGGV